MTAIVSPFGNRTTTRVDNGWLAAFTDPAGRMTSFATASTGLLLGVTGPAGSAYSFAYDDLGRLATATDPVGGTTTLTRTDQPAGWTVALTTPRRPAAAGRNQHWRRPRPHHDDDRHGWYRDRGNRVAGRCLDQDDAGRDDGHQQPGSGPALRQLCRVHRGASHDDGQGAR